MTAKFSSFDFLNKLDMTTSRVNVDLGDYLDACCGQKISNMLKIDAHFALGDYLTTDSCTFSIRVFCLTYSTA